MPVVNRDVRSLAATQQYAKAAPINLVYVSDYGKMADRFKDKKPIYAAFHAGSISQNVYLYCASAGLGAVVRDSVDRDSLKEALNLRDDQVIVMAQSVGYAPSQPDPLAREESIDLLILGKNSEQMARAIERCPTARCLWLVLTVTAVLGLPAVFCAADAPQQTPNVVFILADDLGWSVCR